MMCHVPLQENKARSVREVLVALLWIWEHGNKPGGPPGTRFNDPEYVIRPHFFHWYDGICRVGFGSEPRNLKSQVEELLHKTTSVWIRAGKSDYDFEGIINQALLSASDKVDSLYGRTWGGGRGRSNTTCRCGTHYYQSCYSNTIGLLTACPGCGNYN